MRDTLSAADTSYPRFLPVGDLALSVEFGNASIPPERSGDRARRGARGGGIAGNRRDGTDVSIAVDLLRAGGDRPRDAGRAVRSLLDTFNAAWRPAAPAARGRRWVVPVAYGGVYGDDLEEAASLLGTVAGAGRVAALRRRFPGLSRGVQSGAPNLGGLPEPLHIARRTVPRPSVPASSVAIGGMQSGITSVTSPTGWYVLGRTPAKPYDEGRIPPFLFESGDRVRFRPISPDEFEDLARAAPPGAAIAELEADR